MAKPKPKKESAKALPESEVISMMRRDLNRKLHGFADKFSSHGAQGKTPGTVVSPGLKLKRKEDNTLVTVVAVNQNDVIVEIPPPATSGEHAGELYTVLKYTVLKDELDDKYELY